MAIELNTELLRKVADKRKQIDKALEGLRKNNPNINIGFNNIVTATNIETPFVTLNNLNNGGIPRGKIGVIAGPSQTGKSTLLLQVIGHNMQLNPDFYALWSDVEDSLDRKWLSKFGVDPDRLIVQNYDKPSDDAIPVMETILDEGIAIVGSRQIDMWVIDSIGALLTKADANKSLADNTMLDLQRKMGTFFRKLLPVCSPRQDWQGTAVVLIGQVYNVPTTTGVGLDEVRGGNSVKHFAHWRWKTRRGSRDEGPQPVDVRFPDGNTGKIVPGWAQHIKLDKSKINEKESQEIILQFVHGRGLDSTNSAITALIANEIIARDGAMYSHKSFDKPIRGRDTLIKHLQDNVELRTQLIKEMDVFLAQRQADSGIENE